MQKKLVLFFLTILVVVLLILTSALATESQIHSDSHNLGGNITQDTILTDTEDTYILSSDINVKAGVKLSILNNVKVDGQGYSINVYGELNVKDAALYNVNVFTPNTGEQPSTVEMTNSTMANGSLFNPTGNSSHAKIILRNNHFYGLKNYSYIWYPSEPVYIENNTFDNCGGLSIGSRVDVYIRNNVFANMTTDFAIKDWAQYEESNCYVNNNSFLDNSVVLRLEYDDGGMVASYNWWNTTDETAIAKRIIDGNVDFSIAGIIEYLPILSTADPNTPLLPSVNHIINVTGGAATVAGLISGEYYVGDAIFTVTCENACVVAYTCDGGDTYTRLKPQTTRDINSNTRTFIVPMTEETIVFVGLNGDVDLNGSVTRADATKLSRYVAGWDGYEVNMLTANVDGNGTVNRADATKLSRFSAGWDEVTELFMW